MGPAGGQVNFAPRRVPRLLKLRLARMGRRDRRSHSETLDSTITHAVQWLQGYIRTGQHLVNSQFMNMAKSEAAARVVMLSQLEDLENQIRELKARSATEAGRTKARTQSLMDALQMRSSDLRSQIAANLKTQEMLQATAVEALSSWVTFYEQSVSVYLRARERRRGQYSQPASLPSFTPVPLANIAVELGLDD